MFSKTRLRHFFNRNIRVRFVGQLVVASAALLAVFSFITYILIRVSIYDNISNDLINKAKSIAQNKQSSTEKFHILSDPNIDFYPNTYRKEIDGKPYMIALYPLHKYRSEFIQIKYDLSANDTLLRSIANTLVYINLFSIILIIIFSFFLSSTLLKPIKQLTTQLAKMNENYIASINVSLLPDEFKHLGKSINTLIKKIQNYTSYQKELFIGTAHELKTPLAVMKTKNEVTLIKKRDSEEYINTLKLNNKKIDDMNNFIANILKIGRQESAQFERPELIDIIQFLHDSINEYKLIANPKSVEIKTRTNIDCFKALIQPTLLMHIIQNFMQNAIKFSEEGSVVELKTTRIDSGLLIEVIDSGPGIDPSVDLFAPFKRAGDKAGTGLGLFLAKSAADGLGAKIEIRNREDNQRGCIASLEIYAKSCCDLAQQLIEKNTPS